MPAEEMAASRTGQFQVHSFKVYGWCYPLAVAPRRVIPLCAGGRDLSELEIRTALIQSLPHSAVVFQEFPASGGRLDLLAISGPTLAGFEIKSDFDSLQRVKAQVTAFSRYCDLLTFVAGRRLALSLLPALPVWCGVSLAYRPTSDQIILLTLRHPKPNPLISATASISILRRDELLAIAPHRGHSHGRRRELEDMLLAEYSFTELRKSISIALMLRRQRTRAVELQTSDDG